MYIYKIIIKNFRNLQDFTWKPDKSINVLFGHNGCGKTNIAEALDYLFTPNKYKNYFDKNDYYLGNQNNKIVIQAWLADIEDYKEEFSLDIQHIDKYDKMVFDDDEGETREVLILQLESADEDKMEWTYVLSTGLHPCSIKARAAIDYKYIDTSRNPVKEVGLQEKSIFYQLAKDRIGDELKNISNDIIAYANNKLSKSTIISDYLTTLKDMGRLDIIDQYILSLKDPASSRSSSGYELATKEGDAELKFDRQSSGIQSLFLLLLMKQKLKGAGIVFIEELEQSLEPKNQKYIADEYRRLNAGQIFITSHSVDIISHFNHENIFVALKTEAKKIIDGQDSRFLKEVSRTNKKEFISSLMSDKILLVEGESELGSFPVYSSFNKLSFGHLGLEMIRVGGKGNFRIYVEAYKKFGKEVFVLLDNDDDNTTTINSIKNSVQKIILANNDYEDMILTYISDCANELNELIDFQIIKNKLIGIADKNEKNCSGHEKKIKKYILENKLAFETLTDYQGLAEHLCAFKFALHDSFATTYYATALANIIVENKGVPDFFADIMDCINGHDEKLELKEKEDNIWLLRRE